MVRGFCVNSPFYQNRWVFSFFFLPSFLWPLLLCLLVCASSTDLPSPGGVPVNSTVVKFLARVGPCSPELREKRERFFKWCESVGATSLPFEWRDEGVAGSGLFALEDVVAGDIGTIPLNATISASSLARLGWTAKAIAAGMNVDSDVVLLASHVLYEKWVNNFQGFAGPYIETLPAHANWAPCMWSQDDIAFSAKYIPSLHEEVMADVENVHSEYSNFLLFLSDKQTWNTTRNITFEDYCYARMMVTSRWFGVNDAVAVSDVVKFHTVDGITQAQIVTNSSYNANHMVPFLDLFNHNLIADRDDPTYFAEISSWDMLKSPNRFTLLMLQGGEVKKGAEVFITYGARAVYEMLMHYGFVPNLPQDYFEPSIYLDLAGSQPDDPMVELRLEAIATCWPMHGSNWRPIMPK